MKWYFNCPLCKAGLSISWESNGKESNCPKCKNKIKIPTPGDQYSAYVDQHDWPEDMATIVYSIKGNTCIIQGCNDKNITLDHIVPWDNSGRTCVNNLQPMCQSHNSSKGVQEFNRWLIDNKLNTR